MLFLRAIRRASTTEQQKMAKGSEAPANGAEQQKAVSGPKFRRVQQVTVPTLKLENEVATPIKIETPMTTSSASRVGADGKPEKPATVVRAIDLRTGEAVQVVVPTVLQSNLNTHYPNNSYVGKSFEVTMHPQQGRQRYRTVDVWEIEPE
jgi:hypothetical protein